MAGPTISDTSSDQASTRGALLRELFRVAVETAHPRNCLAAYLPEPPAGGRILVVGAGKANAAMAVATEQHYAARGQLGLINGFVTTRHGFELPTQHLEVTCAAHPVPDEASAVAATRALAFVASALAQDTILVLLSGGASSLWSAPVDGVSATDKQQLTRQLLKSGARISEINTVRRHLSRIKGGRLAAAAPTSRLITLAISDVPGDEPQSIGSGPTVADPSTLADAIAVLAHYRVTPPPNIARALANPINETLKPGAVALSNTTYQIIAAPGASIKAAALIAERAGYKTINLGDALEGEARDVGVAHAKLALEARAKGQRIAILSGGEFTVTVTGQGAGGPNQEYALGLAIGLGGAPGISALACDTDGIDGGGGAASDPAGALVFPDTLSRALALDMNASQCLANNNSTAFFRRLGDLVDCGPTQTNVNDFRVILVDPI
jgi:glycerate 2-kinase